MTKDTNQLQEKKNNTILYN